MGHDEQLNLQDCEPLEWFVHFTREYERPWVKWLAWGEFRHVSAFGFVKASGVWVFYDYMASRTRILIVTDEKANLLLGQYSRSGVVVRMPAPIVADHRSKLKLGLWCVISVAHLMGLSTCALRPDTLLKHCLANGGTIIADDRDNEKTRRRSGTEASA